MKAKDNLFLGVDIGGTFTDLALVDSRSGEIWGAKVLTDYADLSRGVLNGVGKILGAAERDAASLRGIVHGTTLVTNALIERKGVKTALVVTRGFADILLLARESRYDIYELDLDIPTPLIPRSLVFEVEERLNYRGDVLKAPATAQLEALAARLLDAEVESIAVCLLHAYANPTHEQQVKQVLRRLCPGIAISLSSEVIPVIREYERANTTAANAYVQPLIEQYLGRVNRALAEVGFTRELTVVTSDGGVASCTTASNFPVRLTESGPAGGALAASWFGARKGILNLMAYDMGGTTAKMCLIEDGKPEKDTQFEFGRVYRFARGSGLPLQIPVIKMIEIGAGGGSIARVNELGLLEVGPDSANATPGPACYGLGGTFATVSDADLCLGYLSEDFFLGGSMRLDRTKAEAALREHVAKPLNLPLTRAAWGVHRVVNDNMARAAKVHCLEQGKDPRRYVLFAYGGAGPVHAYGVARALGITRILYPLRAGVLSAIGFLVANPSFEMVHGKVMELEAADLPAINALLAQMEKEALDWVKTVGAVGAQLEVVREAALRYEGQSYELSQPLPRGKITKQVLSRVRDAFIDLYTERYHPPTGETPIEFVRWRVQAIARQAAPILTPSPGGATLDAARKGERMAYVPEAGDFAPCPVYDRYKLPRESRFAGPAIIEEIESTAFIGTHSTIEVDAQGDITVTLLEKTQAPHPARALTEKPVP